MPSTTFLRASLALWRRRFAYRNKRLNVARRARDPQRVVKWTRLLRQAAAMVHRRERQLGSRNNTWCFFARRQLRVSPGSFDGGYPGRIVWHTTEGSGDPTSTLDLNHDWPHFTILRDGTIIQYLPIDHMAAALRHTETTPTNGAHAIQIEVVGRASSPKWPHSQLIAAQRLSRWIESNAGVNRRAGVIFHSPAAAAKVGRMSNAQWARYSGHCGHQHVPQNDHVDPGAINIEGILAR